MAGEAAGEVDLGHLTPTQQEALQQYTDVTGQDVQGAISVLQRSQWNVQIAITKFFDGEGQDPVAEAISGQSNAPPVGSGPRFDTLLNDDPLAAVFERTPQRHDTTASRPQRTPVALEWYLSRPRPHTDLLFSSLSSSHLFGRASVC